MKKLLYTLIPCLIVLASCNKEKTKTGKLNRGHGTWLIETVNVAEYDTLGNQTWDTTITEPGELIFFDSKWGVSNNLGTYVRFEEGDSASIHNFDYYTDGNRVTISGSGFEWVDGNYSIQKSGRENQEWVVVKSFVDPYLDSRIAGLRTMNIKKKRSF